MPKLVLQFSGEHSFLSNFAPIPVVVYSTLEAQDVEYPTAEHAFQAAKTLDIQARQKIAAAPTPNIAKRLGRQVALRPDWDERIRYTAMATVIMGKFRPGLEVCDQLLATGDAVLVESNTWHDNTWGDCLCGRSACHRPGRNLLGLTLMTQRARLRGDKPVPRHAARPQ